MVKTTRTKTTVKETISTEDKRQFKNLYPQLDQHQMQIENGCDEEEFSGPLTNRSCQDVICCIIFLVFWVGMGYISFIALRDGQPERLLYGTDSFGNICGRKNDAIENITLSGLDMREKSFLFIFNPATVTVDAIPSKKICVANCPNESLVTPDQYADYEICLYNLLPEDYNALHLASDQCPRPPVPSSSAILNRCVPATLIDAATTFVNTEWINTVLADIETSWKEICYLCTIAIGLSICVLIVLRFFAGFIIWFLLLLFVTASTGGTGYLWYRWYSANKKLQDKPVEDRSELDIENVKTLLIYSGIASGVTVVLLLILLVMRKRIALTVALFKEAGKVLAAIPLLLLQPIWALIAVVLVLGGCGMIFLFLITAGTPQGKNDGTIEYVEDEMIQYMKYYYIFGILWGTQFVLAFEQCVTAGAVAEWFFARDKKALGSPICKSMGRVIRYHIGSIAFGSFIIAAVMLARLILGYIQSKLRSTENQLAKYILKCLQCCLWLFEKVLRYINRNAYIEIAIYGYSFCKSAQKAFLVIVSNALRVAAINSVGDFLLLLAKISVTAGVIAIGIEFFQENPDVNFYAAPIAVAAIFAFIVSHIFLSVYEMAIDTLFICFCEDCEMNDGLSQPYFMSRNLMNFVEKAKTVQRLHDARRKTKK